MADDISVVNSARVSFAKSQQEMDESAKGLINFLMREKHGTPFEHNAFRFHVKCPVFVAREWFRHRIGSFNEFSARYSEVGEDFFVPYQNDVRSQVGKPGAYEFRMVEEEIADQAIEIISRANSVAYESYKELIDIGIAKELSRTVLPVGMYTQFYWTVNARSLMNFLSLRLSKTAQLDIRKYAKSVEAIFADKMPVTYKAWVENGMNCP
jgi:thymidylate synthase (FAD)